MRCEQCFKPKSKRKKVVCFATIILILYLSPLFILGENAHIRIHDNLDSNLSWYKVLTCSGEIQGPINSTIPQVINNQLSRNAFSSEFSGIVWLYAFSKYGCLCIKSDDYKSDRFYRHVCTFKTSFLPKEEWTVISIGVSLAFALTPFGHQECLVLWECLLHFGHFKYSKREKLWKNYFVLTLILYIRVLF